MSTCTHPDANGVSIVCLGGEEIGTITAGSKGQYRYKSKLDASVAGRAQKNLAIKALVTHFRSEK